MLVTNQFAARLHSLGVKANVSLDGDPSFHDHFRNFAGAFRATERGVRALAEAGVPVTIVTTISQGNLASLPIIAQYAADMGAVELRVQPLLKLGRGVDLASQRLTGTQMNRMLLQLSDIATRYRPRGMTCSLNGVSRRFLQAHPCGAYVCNGAGCHRRVAKEIKKIVVREDGTVLPEITNLSHRFALGNLRDGSLLTLVKRYFDSGYEKFDYLCRAAYAEVVPDWEGVIIPWDQIVAERSHQFADSVPNEAGSLSCGRCSTEPIRGH
jgi:MoaA/NifB/PqqE/SkfB family radical SAM enzyme